MELYELKQSLLAAKKKLTELKDSLDLPHVEAKLAELEELQQGADFWNDPKEAQRYIKEYNTLKGLYQSFNQNNDAVLDLLASVDELNKNYDQDVFELVEEEYSEIVENFEKFEIDVLLSHDYDHSNAILEIHPGAGGTESQDWAMMLYRM